MAVKIFFVGNVLAGDDGIGPYLYNELKENPALQDFELIEMGVLGLDMIGYVEDKDKLIIVDAIHSKADIGKIILIDEKQLTSDLHLVSQHDFGVEETAKVLRTYKPNLKTIKIIGINVHKVQTFHNSLSPELLERVHEIKKEVVSKIVKIAEDN
jgi:hydrogenase maturation protease